MNRYIATLAVVSVSSLFILATTTVGSDKEGKNSHISNDGKERISRVQNVHAVEVPKTLSFSGEQVPLHDIDVYERLDRELVVNSFRHSNTFLVIKRAAKYFPIIEPILKRNGIPEDFKYLAVIESDLTHAVSPAGARGIWQIMKGTAKELGLEVNSNVDERYHIEKATQAACEYLIESKAKLGSWTLAAAAYNAGRHGIRRRLEEQKVDNYYDMLLGEETGRYVFRILALKQIMSKPNDFGFHIKNDQKYKMPEFYNFQIDTAITDLVGFTNRFGCTYKELKKYNPWLREKKLNNESGKQYFIKLPKK